MELPEKPRQLTRTKTNDLGTSLALRCRRPQIDIKDRFIGVFSMGYRDEFEVYHGF